MAGFIQGPREAETDRAVEVDGRLVVGGDFEVSTFDFGGAEADQAFRHQCPAQS